MQGNFKKNQRTNQTPCMQYPLYQLLGNGSKAFCKEILGKTFEAPEGIDQHTHELLQALQRYPKATNIGITEITRETFQVGWKKIIERTSAGISGIHFGHLKACALDDILSDFEVSFSNTSFISGYSPMPWKKGINVMIHKKAHNNLVTKLHTITLMEADFNFNNKILGRATIQHPEKYGMLPDEQYGSRPKKSAIDHAIH